MKSNTGNITVRDLRINNPMGFTDLVGLGFTGKEISNVNAFLTLEQGWGRTITVSADYVDGIGMQPTQFTLPDMWRQSVITMPLDGVAGPDPGVYPVVLKIVYDGNKTIEYTVFVNVVVPPPFVFAMNSDGTVHVTSNKYFNSFYEYSLTGRRLPADAAKPYIFDSNSEVFYFALPYTFGRSRTITLDNYELYRIGRFGRDTTLLNVPGDGWDLELMSDQLAPGEDLDSIRLQVHGQAATHFDLMVKNLRFIVHEDGVDDLILDADHGINFAPMRFRMFDMLWDHYMGPNSPKMTVGYDTAHVMPVAGSSYPAERVVLDQVLGETIGKYRPFRYQWGRKEDGHQVWFSSTNTSGSVPGPAPTAIPGDSLFRTIATGGTNTWYTAPAVTDTYWSNNNGGGPNNPCPTGYRLPIVFEVNQSTTAGQVSGKFFRDYYTNQTMSQAGAMDAVNGTNPLTNGVIPYGRNGANGSITGSSQNNCMWTCTTGANATQAQSVGPNGNLNDPSQGGVVFGNNNAQARSNGYMIRCISLLPSEY